MSKEKKVVKETNVYFNLKPKCHACTFMPCNKSCFETAKLFTKSEKFKDFARAASRLKLVDNFVIERKFYDIEMSFKEEIKKE